jgi:hypothetical protein
VSRYCKTEFGLSEAAIAHVIQCCDNTAMLYHSTPASSTCYHHVEACSDGIPLVYEVLQLTVRIDNHSRQLFEPLFPVQDEIVVKTWEENVDVHGFSTLVNQPSTSGTIVREWKWMTSEELLDQKAKGIHAPPGATKLDVLTQRIPVSSLLVGIESCAPLKENIFGADHGLDAKSKELSAFGTRKWRDFRNGSQAVPSDIGGIRFSVNAARFAFFKKLCAEIALCQPSSCFGQEQEPRDEIETFQLLLRSSSHDILNILGTNSDPLSEADSLRGQSPDSADEQSNVDIQGLPSMW